MQDLSPGGAVERIKEEKIKIRLDRQRTPQLIFKKHSMYKNQSKIKEPVLGKGRKKERTRKPRV